VVFELISLQKPWNASTFEQIESSVVAGKRPQFSKEALEQVQEDSTLGALSSIMERCWTQKPLERSHLRKILLELHKLKRYATDNPKTQRRHRTAKV
jgi:hypothetical protein